MGAPGVTPSSKNNSRNFSKDSPSRGGALNSFTHEGWSLNHLCRGASPGDLPSQATRDTPQPGGCGVELGNDGIYEAWTGTEPAIPGSSHLYPRSHLRHGALRGSKLPISCHREPRGMVAPSQLRLGNRSGWFVCSLHRVKAAWPGSAWRCCLFSQHSWRSRTGPCSTQPVPTPPGSLPACQPVLPVLGCLRAS